MLNDIYFFIKESSFLIRRSIILKNITKIVSNNTTQRMTSYCCPTSPEVEPISQDADINLNERTSHAPPAKTKQQESLVQYSENSEVMEIEGIDIDNIDEFIDYLKDSYRGIDESVAENMKKMCWSSKADWKNTVFEGKEIEDGILCFSIILFEKREDSKVDCKYALHKLDLRKSIETYSKSYFSILGKAFTSWNLESSYETGLSKDMMNELHNFFRYKAYKALLDQGKIKENNVPPPTKGIEEILSPTILQEINPTPREVNGNSKTKKNKKESPRVQAEDYDGIYSPYYGYY